MQETNRKHIMLLCPHCNRRYEAAIGNNPLVKDGLVITPLPINQALVIEVFTNYFLRYTADVPANEASRHEKFDSDCKCQPDVTFDEENGWRTFKHKSLEK